MKRLPTLVMTAVALTCLVASPVKAHDWNPAPWRGEPLGAFFHWFQMEGEMVLEWTTFDDDNPDTYLYEQVTPSLTTEDFLIDPALPAQRTTLTLPNFVDEEPYKFLRIQLTWDGLEAPFIENITGFENGDEYTGEHVFSSPISPFTQPDGGYQYHDWVIEPNPDWETISIVHGMDTHLTQIAVDTISTIPEPASLAMLATGALLLARRRRPLHR